eukprot:12445_1
MSHRYLSSNESSPSPVSTSYGDYRYFTKFNSDSPSATANSQLSSDDDEAYTHPYWSSPSSCGYENVTSDESYLASPYGYTSTRLTSPDESYTPSPSPCGYPYFSPALTTRSSSEPCASDGSSMLYSDSDIDQYVKPIRHTNIRRNSPTRCIQKQTQIDPQNRFCNSPTEKRSRKRTRPSEFDCMTKMPPCKKQKTYHHPTSYLSSDSSLSAQLTSDHSNEDCEHSYLSSPSPSSCAYDNVTSDESHLSSPVRSPDEPCTSSPFGKYYDSDGNSILYSDSDIDRTVQKQSQIDFRNQLRSRKRNRHKTHHRSNIKQFQFYGTQYSSTDKIIIGEMDFSLANAIANEIGGQNITATAYYPSVANITNAKCRAEAIQNMNSLKEKGSVIELGLDATNIHDSSVRYKRFDKVIFGFPYSHSASGPSKRRTNEEFIRNVFLNVKTILNDDGEFHLLLHISKYSRKSQKTTWKIEYHDWVCDKEIKFNPFDMQKHLPSYTVRDTKGKRWSNKLNRIGLYIFKQVD